MQHHSNNSCLAFRFLLTFGSASFSLSINTCVCKTHLVLLEILKIKVDALGWDIQSQEMSERYKIF